MLVKNIKTVVTHEDKSYIVVSDNQRHYELYDINNNHIATFEYLTNLTKKIKSIK